MITSNASNMNSPVKPLSVERVAASASRVSAEDGRRAAADEVRETIATLTTLLTRMEAVEALRRDARKDTE